jgi:hypothetical protein
MYLNQKMAANDLNCSKVSQWYQCQTWVSNVGGIVGQACATSNASLQKYMSSILKVLKNQYVHHLFY